MLSEKIYLRDAPQRLQLLGSAVCRSSLPLTVPLFAVICCYLLLTVLLFAALAANHSAIYR